MSAAPYPWLTAVWQRLLTSREEPAQALLLAGPAGVGKRALAEAWAQALLCESPTPAGAACGQCVACHWLAAGTHPDFQRMTRVEKESRDGEVKLAASIEVDQARAAVDFVQRSTHRAGARVLLIDPADALNPAAANALLKVLEEPPPKTVFLLIADRVRQLLPTIRSRAQRIDIGVPARAVAEAWLREQGHADAATRLALTGGAPLRAQHWDSHQASERQRVLETLAQPDAIAPVGQADAFKDIPPAAWHALAYPWLADLLACSRGARAYFNPDFAAPLAALGGRAATAPLLRLARLQADSGRILAHPLNRALQLEAWLLQYQAVFDSGRPS